MTISEKKMQIVIDNYFKSECDVNTSIRQAFEKGFRIGVKKGQSAEPERKKMNIVVIRFKNRYEFSFNCESATISIDKMSGKLCGYSFKGFDDKRVLHVDLDDVEIVYSVLKEESE